MAFSSSNALNLLSAYDSSSDASEEEIPGCRFSVKRSTPSSERTENSFKKQATDGQKKRLPPPSGLLLSVKDSNVNDQANESTSTNDHDGRVRSFPHERGNWASYVYIPVEATNSIESFIDVVCTTCDPSLKLQRLSDLHVSLTKTVVLRHHWINPISLSVQSIAQSMMRFSICLGEVKVYTNEEQTRTFIGIVVTAGHEALCKIALKLDEAFADFKLPAFYEEASFHISIASCVGKHADQLQSDLSRLQTTLDMFIHSQPLQWSLNITTLNFRTGNKYFAFNLLS